MKQATNCNYVVIEPLGDSVVTGSPYLAAGMLWKGPNAYQTETVQQTR